MLVQIGFVLSKTIFGIKIKIGVSVGCHIKPSYIILIFPKPVLCLFIGDISFMFVYRRC